MKMTSKRRLTLTTETVRRLDDGALQRAAGGGWLILDSIVCPPPPTMPLTQCNTCTCPTIGAASLGPQLCPGR
jgi:hypothetical protein